LPNPITEELVEDGVTGDEPMAGAQASCLKTSCEETEEELDSSLTRRKPRRGSTL
jgi:hypothetical protein